MIRCIWDMDEDERGNVRKVAAHGLTIEEVEQAIANTMKQFPSRSSGRPMLMGRTDAGDTIMVVYESADEDAIYVVTAYPTDE
jgi:uncharacterized DUF497 family protein